jgi:hypothetical protein
VFSAAGRFAVSGVDPLAGENGDPDEGALGSLADPLG